MDVKKVRLLLTLTVIAMLVSLMLLSPLSGGKKPTTTKPSFPLPAGVKVRIPERKVAILPSPPKHVSAVVTLCNGTVVGVSLEGDVLLPFEHALLKAINSTGKHVGRIRFGSVDVKIRYVEVCANED